MKKKCVIVQSGGPTSVINSSLIGIIDEIESTNLKYSIYGSVGGIQGLLTENFIDLTNFSKLERLKLRFTPGSALGTCRYELKIEDAEKIIENLKKHSINYLFIIGGNGSMYVAKMLEDVALYSSYNLAVVGVPQSIDNDILETDHALGYGSAAKFLTTVLLEMKMDVESYPNSPRLTIIETMGRHTGWLAASCSLIKSDENSQILIYTPEIPFELEECINKVKTIQKEKRNIFIIISEGIKNNKGKLINEESIELDSLKRPILGGVSSYLKNEIEKETNIPIRVIVPSILQRSGLLLSSKTDIDEAYELGKVAWRYSQHGLSGIMVGINRLVFSDEKYEVSYNSKVLKDVIEQEKFLPSKWYDSKSNTLDEEFINYVRPLIKGEVTPAILNGLPNYKTII